MEFDFKNKPKQDNSEVTSEATKSAYTVDSVYGDFDDKRVSEIRVIHLADIIEDVKFYLYQKLHSLLFLPSLIEETGLTYRYSKSVADIYRNESGNLYNHIGALIIFIAVQVYLLRTPNTHYFWNENIVFPAIYYGALLCLMMSWLFLSISRNEYYSQFNSLIRIDYFGIAILVVVSYIPWIYYTFNCGFCYKVAYLGLVSLSVGATWLAMTKDKLRSPQSRWIRIALFIALIKCVGIPLLYFVLIKKCFWLVAYCAGSWMLLLAILYLTALFVYTTRPWGVFSSASSDLFFLSHQALHVFVFAAGFVHLHGIK